jgi:hypothetical protein
MPQPLKMNHKVHPNHNVYILGAGFSMDAGLPLISNFLNRMRDSFDWLIEEDWQEEIRAVERVFNFRLQAAGAAYRTIVDVENIEDLFSLASATESDLDTNLITVEDISTAIASTLEFTQATASHMPTCELITLNKPVNSYPGNWTNVRGSIHDKAEITVPLYHVYAGILSGKYCNSGKQRNAVITLNYDTLLEDALYDQGIKFNYGITSSEHKEVSFDSSAKCVADDIGDSDALPVLKLHGSVNWGGVRDKEESLNVFGNYADVRRAKSFPVLIPPTWRKVFGGALTQVWGHARHAISQATRIIIIGFSIPPTDNHFKYLLAAGLRDNISLKQVYFINPDARLSDHVFKIFRSELGDRGVIQIQPKTSAGSDIRARFVSDILSLGTQNIMNRRLSEDYVIKSFQDSRGINCIPNPYS